MTERRLRGRPKGTGIDDTVYLARVADLLVANPDYKPTKAMRKLIAGRKDWRETQPTLLRRWQVKWRVVGAEYLMAAQRKAATETKAPTALPSVYAAVAKVAQDMRGVPHLPHLKAIQESMKSLVQYNQHMKDLIDPPHMRAMREALAGIAGNQRIQDLFHPPYLRAIHEQISGIARMRDHLKAIGRVQNILRGAAL